MEEDLCQRILTKHQDEFCYVLQWSALRVRFEQEAGFLVAQLVVRNTTILFELRAHSR